MSEVTPIEAVVVPVVEKTPEQIKAEEEATFIKGRQEAIKTVIKDLVKQLFASEHEFTVDELGWASDAFKQWLQISTTATKEHEEFAQTNQEAQNKFYSLKVKDLTSTYEVPATTTEEAKA